MRIKRNKFGNKKTVVDGITFHSAKEARHYTVLKALEKAGEIQSLELQPKFLFSIDGREVRYTTKSGRKGRQAAYYADFRFWDNRRKAIVVQDVKGMRDQVYRLKQALVHAMWPGTIIEEI